MKNIIVLENKISLGEIKKLAEEAYVFMIKGTVDIANKKVALGGDYHIESCELLTNIGGNHENVWGFNIVFGETENDFTLVYDSLVNIKPLKNKSRVVQDEKIVKIMKEIIENYIK